MNIKRYLVQWILFKLEQLGCIPIHTVGKQHLRFAASRRHNQASNGFADARIAKFDRGIKWGPELGGHRPVAGPGWQQDYMRGCEAVLTAL